MINSIIYFFSGVIDNIGGYLALAFIILLCVKGSSNSGKGKSNKSTSHNSNTPPAE